MPEAEVRFTGVVLAGVIEDDLPAGCGLFEDEGEDALRVSAIFVTAVEVESADAEGEVVAERVHREIGEGEGSHAFLGGVVVVVGGEHAVVATLDLGVDEEGVGRVFVALGEGVEVALVPGGLLAEEDLDDVELELRGGREVGCLGVEDGSEGKKQEEDESSRAGWDGQGGHGTSRGHRS